MRWRTASGSGVFEGDRSQAFNVFNTHGITPESVDDGERRLLCNGFWGISRHVNYLGEVLMATGLALALGWPWVLGPWLYPLYYIALLGTRERDDDQRCAEKYGELWDRYRARVRWRIVPGVY